jgi:leucyl-tRNA synthetase
MVIRDGRKMSKHLGNVVEPDELVERFGADTVRLALLYAARPQRSLNWSDSAVLRCHRFLGQVWDYAQSWLERTVDLRSRSPLTDGAEAGGHAVAGDAEPPKDATEHLRRRLQKWSETAVEKITAEMEQLEMHSAVRNVMRLFDRIKDYEKRVVARQGELGDADVEALLAALVVLIQLLAPMAPHLAEELRIAFGYDDDAQVPWPGVSFEVPA